MPSVQIDALSTRIQWQNLDAGFLQTLIELARDEDLAGAGFESALRPDSPRDVTTSLLPAGGSQRAVLRAREDLVACGLPLVPLILARYGDDCEFEATRNDGDRCTTGEALGTLSGPAREILSAERVILNFLQRLSGVATQTHAYAEALGSSPTRLLDTRKTTPGYRALEKYAVAQGGGWNHRLGLFDRVMLKDNHLAASGATGGDRLREAAARARESWPDLLIEVEIDRLEQLGPIIDAGADVVLLDNFSVADLRTAVEQAKGCIRLEASGGITIETLPELGTLGLDFISTGALVHRSVWRDIGLDWQ